METEESYDEAERVCQDQFPGHGHLANHRDDQEEWIKTFLDRNLEIRGKNEIWIGAQLVKIQGAVQIITANFSV